MTSMTLRTILSKSFKDDPKDLTFSIERAVIVTQRRLVMLNAPGDIEFLTSDYVVPDDNNLDVWIRGQEMGEYLSCILRQCGVTKKSKSQLWEYLANLMEDIGEERAFNLDFILEME